MSELTSQIGWLLLCVINCWVLVSWSQWDKMDDLCAATSDDACEPVSIHSWCSTQNVEHCFPKQKQVSKMLLLFLGGLRNILFFFFLLSLTSISLRNTDFFTMSCNFVTAKKDICTCCANLNSWVCQSIFTLFHHLFLIIINIHIFVDIMKKNMCDRDKKTRADSGIGAKRSSMKVDFYLWFKKKKKRQTFVEQCY